ncbi:MAG: OsmC family protein [Deltaproteobacteria bacterium]|nr:OsmC family protein [Deltaproteobacteria bacterium]
MEMEVSFPGGVAVEARFGSFAVRTDQPFDEGGTNAAPSPFSLFFVSIATCAGFYALRFCQVRKIDTAGLGVKMSVDRPDRGRIRTIRIEVTLPPGFPEKYEGAIVRAIDSCTVKRTILDPPEFEVVTFRADASTAPSAPPDAPAAQKS